MSDVPQAVWSPACAAGMGGGGWRGGNCLDAAAGDGLGWDLPQVFRPLAGVELRCCRYFWCFPQSRHRGNYG